MKLPEIYATSLFSEPLTYPVLTHPDAPIGTPPLDPWRLSHRIIPAQAHVHASVPKTDFWTYDGSVPGPTISVETGWRVRVKYINKLFTTKNGNAVPAIIPYSSYTVPDPDGSPLPMNFSGSDKNVAGTDKKVALDSLTGWMAAHLHGGVSQADSDGWTDNVTGPGEIAEKVYDFPDQQYSINNEDGTVKTFAGGIAPTLWYHDHAMGVTRFNVYSGLAGMWLVRHPKEVALNLPVGSYELALVVQDRNFETVDADRDAELTGQLLHKVQAGVMECFCPATLVNGKLWPHAPVSAKLHRLRVLNGSNARFYRFHFLGLKTVGQAIPGLLPAHFVQQIGTEGGLLAQAVSLPEAGISGAGCLLLAPGERADLLIDFGGIRAAGYHHVVVYNSAPAPFGGGAELTDIAEILTPDLDNLRPYPAVMRFDLQGSPHPHAIGGMPLLGDAFHAVTHEEIAAHGAHGGGHGHSLIVLREEDGMLFLHEMMEKGKADNVGLSMQMGGVTVVLQEKQHDGTTMGVAYVTVAKRFNDTTTIAIMKDSWHVWKIINLSPDTHPFHIHLVQFQGLRRYSLQPAGTLPVSKDGDYFDFSVDGDPSGEPLEINERGWKDTIRVNPGQRAEDGTDDIFRAEMLTLAAQFTGHAGRYMYHCHILEHEDQQMMRPFLVVPAALMNFMDGMDMMPGMSHP